MKMKSGSFTCSWEIASYYVWDMNREDALSAISHVSFDKPNPLQELSNVLLTIYNNVSLSPDEIITCNDFRNRIEDAKYITLIDDRKECFFEIKQHISAFIFERSWEGD